MIDLHAIDRPRGAGGRKSVTYAYVEVANTLSLKPFRLQSLPMLPVRRFFAPISLRVTLPISSIARGHIATCGCKVQSVGVARAQPRRNPIWATPQMEVRPKRLPTAARQDSKPILEAVHVVVLFLV